MAELESLLKEAVGYLADKGIANPVMNANSLMELALSRSREFVIANPKYSLSDTEEKSYRDYVVRRGRHEPLQHIAGYQEFWGHKFIVSPDVMIPRPETEMIVEAGLSILNSGSNPRICEVGTGSGCIIISLLSEIPNAEGVALEISGDAIAVAKQNAAAVGVSSRVEFRHSDVFEELAEGEKFSLIVANPPYVPLEDVDSLQAEVRDFDPHVALTDSADGLSIIRRILDNAPAYLLKDGWLLMEMGFNQSGKVDKFVDRNVWESVEFLPDLQGIPRMLKAKVKSGSEL